MKILAFTLAAIGMLAVAGCADDETITRTTTVEQTRTVQPVGITTQTHTVQTY